MNPWQPGDQPGPEQYGAPQGPGGPSPQYPGAGQPPYPPPGQYPQYQYPQHPQYQYPQYQYPQHPQYSQYPQYPQQPGDAPAPSGATAIAAAVLSFLGALANGLGALANFAMPSMSEFNGRNTGMFVVLGIVSLAIAAALAAGGILLLRRNLLGRLIIAATCGVVIVVALVGYLVAQSLLNQAGLSASASMPNLLAQTIGSVVFPVLTMVLVLLPSTKQWCLAGRRTTGRQTTGW